MASSALPPLAPSGAVPPSAPYGVAPLPYAAAAIYGESGVALPARPDLSPGSAPLLAPTLLVDPLLLRGTFNAFMYGALGYW